MVKGSPVPALPLLWLHLTLVLVIELLGADVKVGCKRIALCRRPAAATVCTLGANMPCKPIERQETKRVFIIW